MMEHIQQFDWCYSQPEAHFVREKDLDNCVTEKILRNKFFDPLLQDGNESDSNCPLKIDWDEVFKKTTNDKPARKYVPGLRSIPPYPKLSALTSLQHYQCLKVLCAEQPNILKSEFVPRPTKLDYKVFEQVQAIYKMEQNEYIEWARSLWTQQCIRALRPKLIIEMVYDAELKMKAQRVQSFPKSYDLAAQIPLESKCSDCDMVLLKELICVNKQELPQIQCPEAIDRMINVIRTSAVPEPCQKHPCQFVLPNEDSVSILPLTEIHQELATYAFDNGAQCVASESALKCLLELDRHWNIPLSVCPVLSSDGDATNIVILGSEFADKREGAQSRTYKALRHLLEYTMLPARAVSSKAHVSLNATGATSANNTNNINLMDESSDDEGDNLFIDDTIEQNVNSESEIDALRIDEDTGKMEIDETDDVVTKKRPNVSTRSDKEQSVRDENDLGIFTCTCKDSVFEKPPPRSFKTWQLRNPSTGDNYSMIVHCAHKARTRSGEVILEPIPEYQIDLGASELSTHKVKSLALSLLLRPNASLFCVRVECPSGDIVTIDNMYPDEFVTKHGNLVPDIANTFHTALNQLQGLLPGNYLLQHEPGHGRNALLVAPPAGGGGVGGAVRLQGAGAVAEADELTAAPVLQPVLLPIHKFRKILPCAFTPHPNQVAKEAKKPPVKQKTPPQAISGRKKQVWRKKKSDPPLSSRNNS